MSQKAALKIFMSSYCQFNGLDEATRSNLQAEQVGKLTVLGTVNDVKKLDLPIFRQPARSVNEYRTSMMVGLLRGLCGKPIETLFTSITIASPVVDTLEYTVRVTACEGHCGLSL